jgi:hypothetical protein
MRHFKQTPMLNVFWSYVKRNELSLSSYQLPLSLDARTYLECGPHNCTNSSNDEPTYYPSTNVQGAIVFPDLVGPEGYYQMTQSTDILNGF